MRDASYSARVDYDADCLLVGDTGIAGKCGRDCCGVRTNIRRRWGVGVQGYQTSGGVDTHECWRRDNSVRRIFDDH